MRKISKHLFFTFVFLAVAIWLGVAKTAKAGITTATFAGSTTPADYANGEAAALSGYVNVSDSDQATANFGSGPTGINGLVLDHEADPYSALTSSGGAVFESLEAPVSRKATAMFHLFPSGITPSEVLNIRIRARVARSSNAQDLWFYLFDRTDNRYLVLGNGLQLTGGAIGKTLKDVSIDLIAALPADDVPGDYFDASNFNDVLLVMIDQHTKNSVIVDFLEIDVEYPDPSDVDGDGVIDLSDNCPFNTNSGQENHDGDAFGDACDPDDDNDTLSDVDEGTLGTNPFLRDSDADRVSDLIEVGADLGNPLDTNADSIIDALDIDDDGDGILTQNEDLDLNSDPTDDDSDGDTLPNYRDADDDGDAIATSDEDLDSDGDPINDDRDGDLTANYLDVDDDGDGILTSDELGADALDPQDLDEDSIVSYLDNCEVPGDFNADNRVSDADWTIWADHYGRSGTSWSSGDANGSSTTSDADWTVWADHYGEVCIPL